MPTKDEPKIGEFVAIVDGKVVTIGNVTEANFEIEKEDQEPAICMTDGGEMTVSINLTRDSRKTWAEIFMLPKYKKTEFMFPKKKKRGTARRRRRLERFKRWTEHYIADRFGKEYAREFIKKFFEEGQHDKNGRNKRDDSPEG